MSAVPPSPASPEKRTTFTLGEVVYGAWVAWLLFVVLLGLGTVLFLSLLSSDPQAEGVQWSNVGALLLPAVFYGGLLALPFAALGVPAAFWLSRALRRTSSTDIHVVAYVLLGAAAGVLGCVVVPLFFGAPPQLVLSTFVAPFLIVPAAIAVPCGWALGVRRARRKDRSSVPRAAEQTETAEL